MMRYWILALLVAGMVVIAGYALVQPLQMPQQVMTTSTANAVNIETRVQATEQTTRQTAKRILVLNISVDSAEFSPGSTIRLKATVMNAGTEEVLLEYFVGQLFEVIIRDESGTIVYVHSDRGFQRYLMIAPLHLKLAPEESHTETMEVPLVYTRGAEKGKPLPPGNYTLTVYLTAAVQGHPSGIIDGVKAYTAASIRITIRPRQ
jgi:hypothetical protein